MSGCHHFAPLLEPFRDGELGPADVVDVEQHLTECEWCAERLRLAEAMRASLKQVVRSEAQLTESFEARIRSALAAERAREERLDPHREAQVRMLSWRSIVPIASAAAVVMVWAASANNRVNPPTRASGVYADSVAPPSVEKLLEDLVRNHERPAAPEITEPSLLPQLEPEVGVPVKIPNFKQYGARWEGVSVVPVSNQRAASLRYRIAGHKLTVYVYDASRMPVRTKLQPRVVRDAPVYVGSRHGVSIAATERRNGVGYAVATDLNNDESAELVASIY
ncbi:MAG TPA: zf-HC2 domain-containing protein [Polyangiaceae bacterium]|nr:zf-HC2 domain-containing protein [Polyangiaceae bacterium]